MKSLFTLDNIQFDDENDLFMHFISLSYDKDKVQSLAKKRKFKVDLKLRDLTNKKSYKRLCKENKMFKPMFKYFQNTIKDEKLNE